MKGMKGIKGVKGVKKIQKKKVLHNTKKRYGRYLFP
jgi:hypothetical protein